MKNLDDELSDLFRMMMLAENLRMLCACWQHLEMFKLFTTCFESQAKILDNAAMNKLLTLNQEFGKETVELKLPEFNSKIREEYKSKMQDYGVPCSTADFDELGGQEYFPADHK